MNRPLLITVDDATASFGLFRSLKNLALVFGPISAVGFFAYEAIYIPIACKRSPHRTSKCVDELRLVK